MLQSDLAIAERKNPMQCSATVRPSYSGIAYKEILVIAEWTEKFQQILIQITDILYISHNGFFFEILTEKL